MSPKKDRCSRVERRGSSGAEQRLGVGDRAPYFRAFAAGSGREVSSGSCAGRRLVLVFHSQNAAYVVEEINRAVRERYLPPEDVVVAGVVDLSLVPPLYWLTASLVTGQVHGRSMPADEALVLQDWGGLYRGPEPVGALLRALEEG